jgi:hypothetical protein
MIEAALTIYLIIAALNAVRVTNGLINFSGWDNPIVRTAKVLQWGLCFAIATLIFPLHILGWLLNRR